MGGGLGKTTVALGLVGAWRRHGIQVAPFKKGPDYIDAAWLGRAAGCACRNLDTYMIPEEALLAQFAAQCTSVAMDCGAGCQPATPGQSLQSPPTEAVHCGAGLRPASPSQPLQSPPIEAVHCGAGLRPASPSQPLIPSPNRIALIEGNRGLYDGMDERGTFSTANWPSACIHRWYWW